MDDDEDRPLDSDEIINYEDLEILSELGKGNFGVVSKADYFGTEVALKEVYQLEDFDVKKYYIREVKVLMKARHPNVVQYMGYCDHNDKLFIITEYLPCGDVSEWIEDQENVSHSMRARLSFAVDTVRALAYLHARSIIHRDLKTDNMLLTENFRVKISDFGLSRKMPKNEEERKRISYCGSDSHMAPEIILCMDFDSTVDVFSLGVVLLELIFLKVADKAPDIFEREIPGFGLKEDVIRPIKPDDCPEEFLNIALRCLDIEPNNRPKIKEVLTEIRRIEAALPTVCNVGIMATTGLENRDLSLNDIRISKGVPLFQEKNSESNEEQTTIEEEKKPEDNIPIEIPKRDEDDSAVLMRSSPVTLARENSTISRLGGEEGVMRVQHNIPHRFSIFKPIIRRTCDHCKKPMHTLRRGFKCDDCSVFCHVSCGPKLPLECGLNPTMLTSIPTKSLQKLDGTTSSEKLLTRKSTDGKKVEKDNKKMEKDNKKIEKDLLKKSPKPSPKLPRSE